MIETRRFDDANAFLDVAGPFLEAREPEHMLTLGSMATLRMLGGRATTGGLVVALEGGHVVATATWTGPWEVVLSEVDDARAIPALVDALGADTLPGVHAPVEHAEAFVAAWRDRTGGSARHILRERIHALEHVTPPAGVPGSLRRTRTGDHGLLVEWMTAFDVESFGAEAGRRDMRTLADELIAAPHRSGFIWDDDGAVSTASTTGETPNGIRVGGVYTPRERRGRGYASACVAAVSQRELELGRRWCFLFTDIANPTSNAIYGRLGYRPVRDVDIWRFGSAPTQVREPVVMTDGVTPD